MFTFILAVIAVCASAQVVFVPNPLPCQFVITEIWSNTYKSGVYSCTTQYYRHGTYFKKYDSCKENGKAYDKNDYIIRSDLKDAQDRITEFDANWKTEKDRRKEDCDTFNRMKIDDVEAKINASMLVFTQSKVFETRTRGTYKEKPCYVYSLDGDTSYKYYVDDDNVLLGREEESYTETMVFDYQYETEAPLSSFIVNEVVTKSCESDAYVAPTEVLCFPPAPSSPSSSSSTTNPSAGSSGVVNPSSGVASPSMAASTKAAYALTLFSIAVAVLCVL